MLVAVSPARKDPKTTRSAARRKPAAKATSKRTAPTFATELAKLLRSRKLRVPRGLTGAPPDAYGRVDASRVAAFADLSDEVLVAQAERVAGWAARQRERAKAEWERSPLVTEIRRRKLKAPPAPTKVVGASVPLRKPLRDWSDAELLRAAKDWSDRGR